MTGLTGWEILAAVGQIESCALPSFVILTKSADRSILRRASDWGVAHCLQKPLCPDEISALVACISATSYRRRTAQLRYVTAAAMLVTTALVGAEPAWALQAKTENSSIDSHDIDQKAPPEPAENSANLDDDHPKWSISFLQEISDVSGSTQPNWYDSQLALDYSPDRSAAYRIELDRSQRFGRSDYVVAAEGNWRVADNASAYLAISVSPTANIKEKWSLRSGGGLGLGSGIEISGDARISRYSTGTRFSLKPALAFTTPDDRLTISAGWINLWEPNGKRFQGWTSRVSLKPNHQLRILGGFARYPEVETGTARQLQSSYAAITFELANNIDATFGVTRDKYENAFSRRSLSIGVSWRWSQTH